MTRLALLCLACSSSAHAPDLSGYLDGDACGRVPVATYTAGADCLKLEDVHGALFRMADSTSCGGPPCVLLKPGETAYALEKVKPAAEGASWSVTPVDCSEQCCGDYLGRYQCW